MLSSSSLLFSSLDNQVRSVWICATGPWRSWAGWPKAARCVETGSQPLQGSTHVRVSPLGRWDSQRFRPHWFGGKEGVEQIPNFETKRSAEVQRMVPDFRWGREGKAWWSLGSGFLLNQQGCVTAIQRARLSSKHPSHRTTAPNGSGRTFFGRRDRSDRTVALHQRGRVARTASRERADCRGPVPCGLVNEACPGGG